MQHVKGCLLSFRNPPGQPQCVQRVAIKIDWTKNPVEDRHMTPPFAFYPQQQPCRTKDLIERKPFCKVSSASNRRVGVSTRFGLSEMEMAATPDETSATEHSTARHITNPGAWARRAFSHRHRDDTSSRRKGLRLG